MSQRTRTEKTDFRRVHSARRLRQQKSRQACSEDRHEPPYQLKQSRDAAAVQQAASFSAGA